MRKSEIQCVLVLSVLILIILSCDGALNDYDYMQVVIQWQPATCSDWNKPPCFQNPTNRFSIHGVWPSFYNGQATQCLGSPFDVNQVNILQPGLSEIWPNVARGDNLWLWRHEWEKHGTCTEAILFDQERYFSFAMDTYIENNLLFILNNNQITPNGQTYTRDRIYAAIRARTGKTPAVRCTYDRWSRLQNLHEITICYNWDVTAFEDCPLNANSCPNSFVWSSWNTVNNALSS